MTRRSRTTDKPRPVDRVARERSILDFLRTGPATARELAAAIGATGPETTQALAQLIRRKAVRAPTTEIVNAPNACGKVRVALYEFVRDVETGFRRWGGGTPSREQMPKPAPKKATAPKVAPVATPAAPAVPVFGGVLDAKTGLPSAAEVVLPVDVAAVLPKIDKLKPGERFFARIDMGAFLFINSSRVGRIKSLYVEGKVEAA